MMQMPGQAQGMQFAPQQAAGTPAAKVQSFKQIQDLPTLIAMQQREPSIPLLAHIDEVRKKLEAQQAVQRQLAVQQSQQQGPQSLNDQILASAAQTAGMAPARGMATGGIVALQSGGSLSVAELQQRLNQARQNHQAALQYEHMFSAATKQSDSAAYRQAQEKVAQTKAALDAAMTAFLQGQSAASMPRAGVRMPDPVSRQYAAETQPRSAAAAPRIPGSSIVGKTGNPDIDIGPAEPPRLPRTRETRDAGSGSGTPAAREQRPAANNPIEQAFAAMTQAYTPPTLSPELLAQRKRVADLQDLYTQQVQQDATQMRGEADKEIARREARANQPFFESAERPALLASYINPKKGQFFGSLAKGIAAIDIEEEKARKELAQYRATEADKVRQLNNTYRQMQIESAKYVAASKENDFKTARESAEKLAALRYKYENDKADLALKKDVAQAQIAAANKQPGEIALMEWLRSPANRKVYEDVQNIKRDEDRQLKLYEIYTKNKLSLGDTTFEQFLAGFKQAGEDVKDRPPSGAVKQKGTQ
jgi:hypothetical protein